VKVVTPLDYVQVGLRLLDKTSLLAGKVMWNQWWKRWGST